MQERAATLSLGTQRQASIKWGHKMNRNLLPSFLLCIQFGILFFIFFCVFVQCPHSATQLEISVLTGVLRVHRCLEEEDTAQPGGAGEAQYGIYTDA